MKKWVKIAFFLILLAILAVFGWEAYEETKPEITFIPHELDEDAQVLRGDLIVELGWQHRREKHLRLNLDREDDRMFYAGDRIYVEPVEIPLHEREIVIIDLLRDGREPEPLYMTLTDSLMPIDINGCSFVHPEYADGVLNLKNSFGFTAKGPDGPGRRVDEAVFHFFRNGEELHTLEGVRQGKNYHEYTTPGAEDVCIPCEMGDEVKITFTCKDGYGIGYEFMLISYTITENGYEEHPLAPGWPPVLTWDK